jgi:hypothetical protein
VAVGKEQRRWIGLGAVLFLVTMLWLLGTAGSNPDQRQMFHLWRNREFLVGCLFAYFAVLAWSRVWGKKLQFWMLYLSILFAALLIFLEVVGFLGLVSYKMLGQYDVHDGLGFKPIPDQDVVGSTYQDIAYGWGYPSEPMSFHFKTDRRGFRNHIDRASADVYLVGDSILVAALVPAESMMATRLEDRFQRPVMNVALVGLSLEEERDIFLEADFPLEDKLVLQFVFEGNDLGDSIEYGQMDSGWSLDDSFVRRAMKAVQQLTQLRNPGGAKRTGEIEGQKFLFACIYGLNNLEVAAAPEDMKRLSDTLVQMNDFVVNAGGTYGVVYVPSKLRVLGPLCEWPENSNLVEYEELLNPLRDFLSSWSRENGIDFLDPTDALIESAADGDIPWFWGDTHPNVIGHKVMADAVANWNVVNQWNDGVAAAIPSQAKP